MRPFAHLRLHTEFSITDSIVRIDDVVTAAVSGQVPALAISDTGNLFGAVKFFRACREAGIQPIIGCEVRVRTDDEPQSPAHLLLLCRNEKGYRHLCQLLSRGYRENQERNHGDWRREWLTAETTAGLIALSGATAGDVGQSLLQGDTKRAISLGNDWASRFPDGFYIELQRAGRADDEAHVSAALNLADVCGLPVVATHPIQFMSADDYKAHEARVCIARGELLGDSRRRSEFTPEQHFKSSQEMAHLFADIPEALDNAATIAQRCHFTFSLGKSRLPDFPVPAGVSVGDFLMAEAKRGLESRLLRAFPDSARREAVWPQYLERLTFEVKTIIQMGFPGYFLIVADFIGWAKLHGIPVGPGRGSGAGSLVAWSLGITDLDPIEYELLFERFLNPERVSMPDFDIDFCQEGRDRVIDYVKQKYGHDSVSQIVTFGTMAAKAVIRDVGRVLGMGYNAVDAIAKLVPNQLGITLQQAIDQEPQFGELSRKDEGVAELVALALKLEGITRNVGMHAGGVLIAPGPLTDFTPLYAADGSEAMVSQYDKDDVEAVGLVKFDFLGLTTLTIVAETENLIRARQKSDGDASPPFDINAIPLDDRAAYEIFARGSTAAIFQFESRGMRDLIMQARPDSIEDLTALNALYRPGPMDLIPEFIARKAALKQGKQTWQYLDERLKPILDPTYGVITYQEHVMTIAQVIGGYSLGGADLLRRAMGKKKPEEMAKQRAIFMEGALHGGMKASAATELFDRMEKFSGYGFNKSHSAAYSYLAYQTAWLKAHYPAEFMSANMSCVIDFTDKVQQLYDDCRAQGLAVLPPDINASGYRFAPVDARTIRYGLGAVKGTGHAAIDSIVKVREKSGAFRDIADFVRRVDRSKVNRRVMEALIRAGAFDSLGQNRATLMQSLPRIIEMAEQATRNANQESLFGAAETNNIEAVALSVASEWGERERLNHEKLALGFYFSGHPFASYEREIRQIAPTRLDALNADSGLVMLAGILYDQRVLNSRKGRMCIITLDDQSARIEAVIGTELFEKTRGLLVVDQPLIVRGRVSVDDFSGGLRVGVDDLLTLEQARKHIRLLKLSMNGQADSHKLRGLLEPHRVQQGEAGSQVAIHYCNGEASMDVVLPDAWRVVVSEPLVTGLTEWLTAENVAVNYDTTNMLPPPKKSWRDGYRGKSYGGGGGVDY